MEFMQGGTILFGGVFAPRDWAFCKGQLLPISENQALFAILGTTWGGDGRTTYALPELRGRSPIGTGQGPGLSNVTEGFMKGTEVMQLSDAHLPTHTHTASFTGTGGGSGTALTATATVNAFNATGNQNTAENGYWAMPDGGRTPIPGSYSSSADTTMADGAVTVSISGSSGGITGGYVTVGATGRGLPYLNYQPSIGINYILCIQGYFPSRN